MNYPIYQMPSLRQLNCKRIDQRFVDEGIAFLQSGRRAYPAHVKSNYQKDRFQNRYRGFVFLSESGDSLLVRQAPTKPLLKVVAMERVDEVLAEHYEAFGDIGRDRFFNFLKAKYIGISFRAVDAFLQRQETHQLCRRVRKQRTSHPIIATSVNERWQCDLADMQSFRSPQNQHTGYLLTVIDCFSKYAWIETLTTKHAHKVAAAMRKIFEESGVSPGIVQSDNGSEFQDEFAGLLEEYGAKHVKSSAYSPQTNGQIERFNGTIKRMIKAYMLANDTKKYVDRLQSFVDLYNQIPHTTTKRTPLEVYDVGASSRISRQTQKAIRDYARKEADRNKRQFVHLAVGDHVRVASISTSIKKKTVVNWSRDIFVVTMIMTNKVTKAKRYQLENGKLYTRDKLQKIVDIENMVHIAGEADGDEVDEDGDEVGEDGGAPVAVVEPPEQRRSGRERRFNVRLEEYW